MNLLTMSLSAGVLIVLIILFRALAIHKVPKGAFLILWGIVIVRLLIPGTVSPLNLLAKAGLITPETIISYEVVEDGEVVLGGGGVELAQPGLFDWFGTGKDLIADGADWMLTQKWPYFIWGLGIGCLATSFLYAYIRSRRVLNMALPVKMRLRAHRGRRAVRVYLSDRIATPLTYGVLRPRIVLPKQMLATSRAHLNYAIRHEMTHIERYDMVYKVLLLICVCLHWYNPLVWAMYFLACRDIELSCDEKVVRSARKDRRKDYAMTLIELEEKRSIPLPLVAALGKTAIEERVVSIMRLKKASISGVLMAVLLVSLSLLVFADAEVTPNVVMISGPYSAVAESAAVVETADLVAPAYTTVTAGRTSLLASPVMVTRMSPVTALGQYDLVQTNIAISAVSLNNQEIDDVAEAFMLVAPKSEISEFAIAIRSNGDEQVEYAEETLRPYAYADVAEISQIEAYYESVEVPFDETNAAYTVIESRE